MSHSRVGKGLFLREWPLAPGCPKNHQSIVDLFKNNDIILVRIIYKQRVQTMRSGLAANLGLPTDSNGIATLVKPKAIRPQQGQETKGPQSPVFFRQPQHFEPVQSMPLQFTQPLAEENFRAPQSAFSRVQHLGPNFFMNPVMPINALPKETSQVVEPLLQAPSRQVPSPVVDMDTNPDGERRIPPTEYVSLFDTPQIATRRLVAEQPLRILPETDADYETNRTIIDARVDVILSRRMP